MLTNLRERSQRSFGVLILFGMLTFIFIFFFGPQSEGCQPRQQGPSIDGWAARINGVELSQREVENLVYLRGDRQNEAQLASMRYDILTRLVDQELLAQRALAAGINVDEKGLTRYITSDDNPDFPAFTNEEGVFDRQTFKDALRFRLGVGPDDYRARKRREFLSDRYRRMLEAQVQVSDAEVRFEVAKELRSWNLHFLKFSPSKYPEADVSDDDVQTFAQKSEDSIKDFYAANKASRFVKGREVKARRILIKKPSDEDGQKIARKKIEELHAKAKSDGTDFAALAAENSEGAGDKAKSGDMGFIRPGAAFYKKVFEPLKVGEISEIQDESIGLFFVKAEAEKPAINQTLDQVRNVIAQELLTKKAQSAAAQKAATDAFAKIKSGVDIAALAKAPVTPKITAEGGEVAGEGTIVAPIAVLPVFAETGPIGDGPRYGQPWDRIPKVGTRALGARSEQVARSLRTLTKESPLMEAPIEIEGEHYIFQLKEKSEGDADAIDAKVKEKKSQMLLLRRRRLIYGESGGLAGDPLAAFRANLREGNQVVINEELYPKPPAPAIQGLPPGVQLNLGN